MTSKNIFLKLAIALISVTIIILAGVLIVNSIQGKVNWVLIVILFAECSLLNSLIKALRERK
ncbi:peptidase [Streptococcus vicugnae]|uniref:Peptidase n=1 Tax=Streptococcus vicugnae TaxID=2740579 RepID=A0A4R5G6W0_9STRE|nr:peptidase [Streptococcus vicugnae]